MEKHSFPRRPVLPWRHSEFSFYIFPEERQVVETCVGGDFLDALVGGMKHLADVSDGHLIDDVGCRIARLLLADGRKIFGGDAELVRIIGDIPTTRCLSGDDAHEMLEDNIGR